MFIIILLSFEDCLYFIKYILYIYIGLDELVTSISETYISDSFDEVTDSENEEFTIDVPAEYLKSSIEQLNTEVTSTSIHVTVLISRIIIVSIFGSSFHVVTLMHILLFYLTPSLQYLFARHIWYLSVLLGRESIS